MSTFRYRLQKTPLVARSLPLRVGPRTKQLPTSRIIALGISLCLMCGAAVAAESDECTRCSAPISGTPGLPSDIGLPYGVFAPAEPLERTLQRRKWKHHNAGMQAYEMVVPYGRIRFELWVVLARRSNHALPWDWRVSVDRPGPNGDLYTRRLDDGRCLNLETGQQRAWNALIRRATQLIDAPPTP